MASRGIPVSSLCTVRHFPFLSSSFLYTEEYFLSAISLQSCLILCDPMDCSLPDSSVHGILQARIPEWVTMSSSGEAFQTQGSSLHLLCLLHRQEDSLPWSHKADNKPCQRIETCPTVVTSLERGPAKPACLVPVFANKVLMAYNHTSSFTYYLHVAFTTQRQN